MSNLCFQNQIEGKGMCEDRLIKRKGIFYFVEIKDTKMKEMENNNFIHTLDAVYNLCSEIKELVNVETEKQEDEGSEGIILLSDNLQRLQSEITEMKTELSYDKERRERLRTAINLRLKELRYIQF